MNIRSRHIFRTLVVMLVCVVATSCSQEQLGIEQADDFISGQCPLKLNASVEGMATRADDTDSWEEDDEIGVRIGEYPVIGRYSLNTDGTVKEAIDASAWPHPEDFVSAWFPNFEEAKKKESIEVSIADQSKGYHSFDFMIARTERKMHYKEIVNLNFKHQMAKVSCKLIKGDGVTEEDLKTAKVSYYGFPGVKFSEQGISGTGSLAYITSASDHSALLVPQDVSGQPFIKVELTLTINDARIPKTLVYTPGTMKLEAGTAYTFNIKVQKDRLEVETISGTWTESLKETVPESDKYQIFLTEDTGELGELEFSKNVTEESADTRDGSVRCLEVLGDKFTIFYKVTADNCHLGPVFADKETLNEVKRSYFQIKQNSENTTDNTTDNTTGAYYEFTYTIASPIGEPVYLKKGEYLEVGDILFKDGTWGGTVLANTTPVGIVFKIGAGDNDIPTNYGWGEDREIRGYAVALNDASKESVRWYDTDDTRNLKAVFNTSEKIGDYYSGLYVTNRINEIVPQKPLLDLKKFTALHTAEEYNAPAAEGSSGWYFPSYPQLNDIYKLFKHPQRRELITKAGGDFLNPSPYWSATEVSQTTVRAETFDYNTSFSNSQTKTRKYYVRTVLTF